jgi:hypothetical protein
MFVQSQNSNLLKIKDSEYLLPDNVFVKIYRTEVYRIYNSMYYIFNMLKIYILDKFYATY